MVLILLAAQQLLVGVWGLLAPRSFYGDFPGGPMHGWVSRLGPYDEHLVRDVGALFLALAVLWLISAVRLDRLLVAISGITALLFAVPHTLFHVLNLDLYPAGDAIAETVALVLTVIGGLMLLWLARPPAPLAPRLDARDSSSPAGPPGSGGTEDPGSAARVRGVPDRGAHLVVRQAYRMSRKRTGAVMEPARVFAHHPALLAAYGTFELVTERASRVPRRYKQLGVMRAAMIAGCEWCLDFGSAELRESGIPDEQLRDLPRYRESERFSELDKLVLDYATGMSRSPVEVSDELFAALREHFDEAQMVELSSEIALENYRARFNWAFGIGSQGFSEGAFCVAPEGPAANGRGTVSAGTG
jgi:AhpD family alkylhydroperoxidase